MLLLVTLDFSLFPSTCGSTGGNSSNFFHGRETHSIITMFLFSTFKVVGRPIVNNTITVFNAIFVCVPISHLFTFKLFNNAN